MKGECFTSLVICICKVVCPQSPLLHLLRCLVEEYESKVYYAEQAKQNYVQKQKEYIYNNIGSQITALGHSQKTG